MANRYNLLLRLEVLMHLMPQDGVRPDIKAAILYELIEVDQTKGTNLIQQMKKEGLLVKGYEGWEITDQGEDFYNRSGQVSNGGKRTTGAVSRKKEVHLPKDPVAGTLKSAILIDIRASGWMSTDDSVWRWCNKCGFDDAGEFSVALSELESEGFIEHWKAEQGNPDSPQVWRPTPIHKRLEMAA